MLYILVVAGILVCALQAIAAKRLLISALWLAGTSALVSLMLYMLGAAEVAVIELSVGAGLVTVLFVFAINIAGDENLDAKGIIPVPLAWGLIAFALITLSLFSLPQLNIPLPAIIDENFSQALWQDRSLDLLLQVMLIFAGVLGILGLLAESTNQPHKEDVS